MRVLHLGKLCPPKEGGIELFTYDLLEYLNAKGIKADLLCFGDKDEESEYNGFRYFSCKLKMKLNSALISFNFIKKFSDLISKYDIIHIHSPNPLAEMLSIFSVKSTIIHWHSDIIRQKISYFFYKPFQQLLLKKAQRIICTSPQYLETSKQIQKFRNKAEVIPSGLNPKRLLTQSDDPKIGEILPRVKGKKIILSIGRLVKYKGFEYLIEASKYINQDSVIIIVGDGDLRESLKEKINQLKNKDKVILIGRVENVANYLKLCDIFVLPSISRNEAFGLVLVEALYFGKPLVTTDVKGSGMSYVNKNGETGFVVPPRDPKSLADAINKILTDKTIYIKFSLNARKRFKEFEISSIGKKIIKIYEEVK